MQSAVSNIVQSEIMLFFFELNQKRHPKRHGYLLDELPPGVESMLERLHSSSSNDIGLLHGARKFLQSSDFCQIIANNITNL